MKKCNNCREEKKLDGFYKNKAYKDGYSNICKDCQNKQCKKYKEKYRNTNLKIGIKTCSYCGSNIKTIGLDRVDSKNGYGLNNLITCCLPCNRTKMDLTQKDFLNKVKQIHNNLQLDNQ